MSYIVSPEWVNKQLKNEENIVIIDVRFNLADPNEGKALYEKSHIKGAHYLDLNKDLSNPPKKHGGNHPLPDIEMLVEKLSEIGVDQQTTVIFYDKGSDMVAARAWWLLYFMGHENSYILDGGYTKWERLKLATDNEIPSPERKNFTPNLRQKEIVDMETVKHRHKKESILIDSRSEERYLGHIEPLYSKAGHIPGAVNYFWKDIYEADGSWKSPEKLQENFGHLQKENPKEIIVSCGSGVSACPNIIALKVAGFNNVKLYPGSFSDWISYEENQLETKDENLTKE